MPIVLRKSGSSFDRNGEMVKPLAMVATCDGCGAENAPYLVQAGGKWQAWCGWRDNAPVCVAVESSPPALAKSGATVAG